MYETLRFLIGMRRILSRIPAPIAPDRRGNEFELDSLYVERAYDALTPEAREAFADVQEWFRDLMERLDVLHREATQLTSEIGWSALQVLAEAVVDGSDDGPGDPDTHDADPAKPDEASGPLADVCHCPAETGA